MRVETYEVEFTCAKCGRSFSDKMRKEVVEEEAQRTCFTCMSPMIQGEAKMVGFVDTEVDLTKVTGEKEADIKWLRNIKKDPFLRYNLGEWKRVAIEEKPFLILFGLGFVVAFVIYATF